MIRGSDNLTKKIHKPSLIKEKYFALEIETQFGLIFLRTSVFLQKSKSNVEFLFRIKQKGLDFCIKIDVYTKSDLKLSGRLSLSIKLKSQYKTLPLATFLFRGSFSFG